MLIEPQMTLIPTTKTLFVFVGGKFNESNNKSELYQTLHTTDCDTDSKSMYSHSPDLHKMYVEEEHFYEQTHQNVNFKYVTTTKDLL